MNFISYFLNFDEANNSTVSEKVINFYSIGNLLLFYCTILTMPELLEGQVVHGSVHAQ